MPARWRHRPVIACFALISLALGAYFAVPTPRIRTGSEFANMMYQQFSIGRGHFAMTLAGWRELS